MKVILQRDIPKVGKHGDVVNVADGFARNYLFPRQLAVSASGGALKAHKSRMDRDKERSAKQLGDAETQAEKLTGLTLILIGKVGTGTKLYGSITANDVAEAIQRERGIAVDKRRVGLVDPIKTLGTYKVPVRLHSDVSIPIIVAVVTEDQVEIRRRELEQEAKDAAEAQAVAEAEAVVAAQAAAEAKVAAAVEAKAAAEAEVTAESESETPAESDTSVESEDSEDSETPAEAETLDTADDAATESAGQSEEESATPAE